MASKKIKPPLFFNRELSWLEFNDRVLSLAMDPRQPLLERVKFLAITASNLDEFFMVRVGGLSSAARGGITIADPSGLSPNKQLLAIDVAAREFVRRQYACYKGLFEEDCPKEGIVRVKSNDLSAPQAQHLSYIFKHELFPVLSPIAVSGPAPFPLLSGRLLYLCVRLSTSESSARRRFAVIPIGKNLQRFISLPGGRLLHFILLEDAISQFAGTFFPGETMLECVPMRIIRNADLAVSEDSPAELLEAMETVIDARKRSDVVRVEIDGGASPEMMRFLQKSLQTSRQGFFTFNGPLDLSAFMGLTGLQGCDNLRNKPFPPLSSPYVPSNANIFDILSKKCVTLLHPYESFEPVIRFIEAAAEDPNVVASKQTLYRTSRSSPIIAALIRAAEKGKSVTAVVELKARFDEERNIEWARELETAGVQVVQGVRGLKTHAKICIVVRREAHGLQRYMHFGTGNYNEITAKLYSDISFFSADTDLGADASAFFNAITGRSEPLPFHKISAAPTGLRETLIELIEAETARAKQGQKAWIRAKMNSLEDVAVIESLYAASCAGVKVLLNVRGICCLAPGVKGQSDNITVISIVDRFLEHARIAAFRNGGRPMVFISSADWMPRNLDKRVELLVPVEDPFCRDRLLEFLETWFSDTINSWRLQSDGRWKRATPDPAKINVRSQESLYAKFKQNIKSNARGATMFKPLGSIKKTGK